MVCKSCGAGLEDDTITCPYCGWENEILAARERENEITEVMDKTREYMHKPEKVAKKTSQVLLWILAGVLVLFGMSIVMVSCTNRSNANKEYQAQQVALIKLERLYAAGNYAAINEYMRDIPDSYSSTYAKYYTVGNLYMSLIMLEENCPRTAKLVTQHPENAKFLDSDLEQLFGLIGRCEALKDAGYVYGEEEPVSDFSERGQTLLRDVFLLTDDEIQSGLENSQSEAPNYAELRDISLERLNGGIG